ncbi:MAG: acyl-CoA dehydrogenase family protein [Promethearchaeota archaeon]|jgi:alkylation response protein AidB-like acyl-CoA dehydrogenase
MFQEKIIDDQILEKMSLENVFKIFNDSVFPMLTNEEQEYCNNLQEFCINLNPKIDRSNDVYGLLAELGNNGYVQRINPWKEFTPYGMKKEILLGTHISILDAQLELARVASGILCGNPTFHYYEHGGEYDTIRRVQDELLSGKKIGCIGITEPERGSDAVNMTTKCTKVDDGVIYNGEKVYTTNGPKADYFCCYGVYDEGAPRETMVQSMISRDFGVRTERLKINSVPRVHISHTILDNVKVPKDYILADDGDGYTRLFEGLVPERLSIMGSGIGICWAGLIYGIIYTNLRKQFGKPVIRYQGVGYGLADLLAKSTAATSLAFQAASIYDEKILFSEKPSKQAVKWVAAASSQGKYYVAKLTHEICYEVQQLMGGISVTDNTLLDELMDVSKIEEVIGGARNIQLLIIQGQIQRYLGLL